MKLKKIILIITLIICSGCNAKYKIEFNDETIKESLNISVPKTMSIEEYRNSYDNSISAIGQNNFYKFDVKENNGEITIKYNYDFTIKNYNSSYIANNCFQPFKFLEDNETYYILGQGNFKCAYYKYEKLNNLDIVVETNHKLIETNADEINDNQYIWHIDETNYNEKEIKLMLSKETIKQNIFEKYKNEIIIGGITSGVLLLILLILFIKHKRVNKI